MTQLNGVHHIAVMAKDMKAHLEFFTDVLGCPLVAIFPMHGVPGAKHAFLKLNDGCYFSLVEIDSAKDIPIELGKTHAGTGAQPSAPGTMQHIAFSVASEADQLALRDRIRSRGVNVLGPIDHGMCKSMYFAGPDQLTLEIACGPGALDPRAWVDPATLAAIGVSAEEAARYVNPAPYAGEGGALAQPPYDPAKPHQAYPEAMYHQLLATPDAVLAERVSYREPPVKVA
jgi:catechol 2,3-dioxygenase-like lactoylglutathione lyase family enzyme